MKILVFEPYLLVTKTLHSYSTISPPPPSHHIGTDVAGEMALFVDTLKPCHTCYKAGVAAVEMLAVSVSIFVLGISFTYTSDWAYFSTNATGPRSRLNFTQDLPDVNSLA